MKARDVTLTGIGGNLPERKVGNDYFERYLETTDEWIRRRTGIVSRYFAEPETTVAELALPAARTALDSAGLQAGDIELIVCATTTPDRVMPATACLLHGMLGAGACPAFDIQAVCTGFVYGTAAATAMIQAGMAGNALVVGADMYSRVLDMQDRSTCVLFGDGAGAAVLACGNSGRIEATDLHADGALADLISTPAAYANRPAVQKAVFAMDGSAVYKTAVRTMVASAQRACASAGCSPRDIDWLVAHQANARIIDATARILGIEPAKCVRTVTEHANTSAASIPLGLASIWDKLKPGDKVLMTAAGAGFTWGSVLWSV